MEWLNRFLRRLVGGLDNQHHMNRKARVAAAYGSVMGPRPNRRTHSDLHDDERPADTNAGLQEANLGREARRAAMERERGRRRARLHRRPVEDRKARDSGRRR